MTTRQRNRGRPPGSAAPVRRIRRDYRFSPETLKQIAQGQRLNSDAPNETAFVEQAIAHHTMFLEGSIQVNQEAAHLQVRVRGLERDLDRSQRELRLAKAKTTLQTAPTPTNPSARPGPRKPLYQILIKHGPGNCPELPDGYGFLYTQEKEYHCPAHLVGSFPENVLILT